MKLTEYLNQSDPAFMPFVELEPGEYKILASINAAGRTIQAIEVTGISCTYVRFADENVLRVQDEHGNPGARSCFYLTRR